MSVLSDVRSVAANTTVANVFAGKTQEFLVRPSLARFGIVAAAVGVFATILIGDTVILEDQEVSGANRHPIDPDDFLYEGAGFTNDRIVVKIRNSTVGAIIVTSVGKINPSGG